MIEGKGFQLKTINHIISSKINKWVGSLPDSLFDSTFTRNDVVKNVVVAGGALTNLLLGMKPNDYDVYFTNRGVAKRLVRYYTDKLVERYGLSTKVSSVTVNDTDLGINVKIKSSGVMGNGESNAETYQYFEGVNNPEVTGNYVASLTARFKETKENVYLPVLITSNAITLTDDIQIILRFINTPENITSTFDFVHTKNFWTAENGVHIDPNALLATMSKTLKYVGSLFPVCALFRTRKFINRGWSISAGEMFKIIWQCNNLNLDDFSVLEDQLTGVDYAYFCEVLTALKDAHLSGDKIDQTYLFYLLDKIFADEGEDPLIAAMLTNEQQRLPVYVDDSPDAYLAALNEDQEH